MSAADREHQSALPVLVGDDMAAIEALLFTSGEPLEQRAIADVMGWTLLETRQRVQTLDEQLRSARRGVRVEWHGERVALTTAPRFGPLLQRFYHVERSVRLSEAAIETLAIIAFQQPVTRAEIEEVRGVDSTGVLNTLVSRELVEIGGRRTSPGAPLEYRTTEAFLQHFGLSSLDELRASDVHAGDDEAAER